MDYVKNIEDMLKAQYTKEEVAENIYLNYQSAFETDEIYKIRKQLSLEYNCNLNDVKLIGSAHTGYTIKSGKLERREVPNDYDFGIIDTNTFVNFFHKINFNNIKKDKKQNLTNNLLNGKIHPLYADDAFVNKLNDVNRKIQMKLNVDRHISVCFYISEKAFIKGLVKFNNKLFAEKYKQIADDRANIESVPNVVLKDVEKVED